MTMTADAAAREMLAGLGLNLSTGDTVVDTPTPSNPSAVDRRTMPVTDIVFNPSLLDGFPDLEAQRKEAADHVFGLYESLRPNKERNRPLWQAVGKFITDTHLQRKAGTGVVAQKVRISTEQKELLGVLASMGINTVADLTALLGQ